MVWIRPLNSALPSIALFTVDSFNVFHNLGGDLFASWLIDPVFRGRLTVAKYEPSWWKFRDEVRSMSSSVHAHWSSLVGDKLSQLFVSNFGCSKGPLFVVSSERWSSVTRLSGTYDVQFVSLLAENSSCKCRNSSTKTMSNYSHTVVCVFLGSLLELGKGTLFCTLPIGPES